MATPTFFRSWPVTKEHSVYNDGANKGNGQDNHIPLGKDNSGNKYRAAIKFAHDWTGVYQIVAAHLVFRSTNETKHIGKGSASQISARRIDTAWPSYSGSEGTWSTGSPTVYGDISTTGASIDSGALGQSGDVTARLDITAIVDLWAPDTIYQSDGATLGTAEDNHGIRLVSTNETDTTFKYEIYGHRTDKAGRRPYIELEYIANIPPLAPSVQSPEEDDPATVESTDADTLTVEFNFADPDGGSCQRVELEVHGDGATDAALDLLFTTGAIAPTDLGPSNAHSVTITGLTARTNQRYRLRVQDSDDSWGPWTGLAVGRIYTAYIVGAPLQSYLQSTPDSPHVFGSLNSQDTSDYITGWEGEFYRDDVAGAVLLWAPDVTIGGSPTRSEETWAGDVLNDGDIVRWRHRHVNRDGVSGLWSTFMYTTIYAEVGPDAMTPIDTSTKLLTRTPELTIGHSASFDAYQYRVYRSGTLLYDSGEVSITATTAKAVTVTSGLLSWGDGQPARPLEWDAAIQIVGNSGVGDFSPRRPIRINSLPSTTLTIDGLSSLGYVDTNDPTYLTPYTDPDRQAYAEWPDAKEYEIRDAATPAGSGALVKHVTDQTPVESEQLGATFVPIADSTYDVRVRFRDDATPKTTTTIATTAGAGATNIKVASVANMAVGDWLTLDATYGDEETRQITNVGTAGSGGSGIDVDHGYTYATHTAPGDPVDVFHWGPWTSWLTFTYTAPPLVTANLPADLATVNDPTRTLSWTIDKTQDHAIARIWHRVGSVDQLIWEETQDGTAITWDIPPFLLLTGETYAWQIEAFDTVGLSDTTTLRTFTTSFSTPTALADGATSGDQTESSIVISWTASVDSYLHHYRVYWQDADGAWARVDGGPVTLGDDETPLTAATFTHYGARLGVNEYRISVHNGAQESDPAYVSGTLQSARGGSWMLVAADGSGAWPIDPSRATRQRNPIVETFRPPGRGSAVHLSWGSGGRSISTSFQYSPEEDGSLSVVLDRIFAEQATVFVKPPEPYAFDPLRSTPVDIEDQPAAAGFMGVAVRFEEVED